MNEFEKVFSIIHSQEKPNIDFNQFKDIFIKYAMQVMNVFLDGKAQCTCEIKPLKKNEKGFERYSEESNTYGITISEEIVKSIYDGTNPFNIFILFHEISHVYDDFKISNKDFKDANLKKICVEKGIMESMPTGELFYALNYKSMAIETHANLLGAQLTRDFYEKCKVKLNDDEHQCLLFFVFFALRELNNERIDYGSLFDGLAYNDYKIPLSRIVDEIRSRYPIFYEKLKNIVGEEILTFKKEREDTAFEKKLYSEYAILELSDIIHNPLFMELLEKKTEYRPKV